jgi:hypothetical protein
VSQLKQACASPDTCTKGEETLLSVPHT